MEAEPPPPSYDEVFPLFPPPSTKASPPPPPPQRPGGSREGEATLLPPTTTTSSTNPLEFLKKADIIPVPVTREVLEAGSFTTDSGVKYLILDGETGAQLLHADLLRTNKVDLRGLSLILDDNGDQHVLLNSTYLYSPTFSSFELWYGGMSGEALGTFRKEGNGPGLLCGCLCLCFCCPMATAALKGPDGQPLAIAQSFLFPRKVDVHRPEHLGGSFMGTIDVERMNSDSIVKTSFGDKASFNDKVIILGLAMSMMDYERVHGARGGNPFSLDNHHY